VCVYVCVLNINVMDIDHVCVCMCVYVCIRTALEWRSSAIV